MYFQTSYDKPAYKIESLNLKMIQKISNKSNLKLKDQILKNKSGKMQIIKIYLL